MTTPLGRLLEISRNAGAPPTPEEQADLARFRRRVGYGRRPAAAVPPRPTPMASRRRRWLIPLAAAATLLLGITSMLVSQMASVRSLVAQAEEARERAGRAEAKLQAVETRLAALKDKVDHQLPPKGITFTLSQGIVRSPKWQKTWKQWYDKDRSDTKNLEWLTPRAPSEIRAAIRWMKEHGRSDGEILAAIRPDSKTP